MYVSACVYYVFSIIRSSCRYFGHAETLMPVLNLLDIAQKEPKFDADETFSRDPPARKYNESRIIPFAASMALIVEKCPDGIAIRGELNERPVRLCQEPGRYTFFLFVFFRFPGS